MKRPTWTVRTGQRGGSIVWTWFMRLHLFLGTSFFGPELQILEEISGDLGPTLLLRKVIQAVDQVFISLKKQIKRMIKMITRHMREFGMRDFV